MKDIIYTKGMDAGYEDNLIIRDLNITLPRHRITALVGANGSGKSTILKAIARILRPSSGAVYLDGKDIHTQKTREIAKKLAILPQNPTAPDGLTVAELICYGRAPYQGSFGSLSRHDLEKVQWAIEVTGMEAFAERPLDQLSGGQRQRAWIAMALAQETDVFLLDEPTSFLDISHQYEVLSLLKQLNESEERTIIMVVHDLNHASRYAHHMIAVKDGAVACSGTPYDVMKPELIHAVFGIYADILTDPRSGVPICLPYVNKEKNNPKNNIKVTRPAKPLCV